MTTQTYQQASQRFLAQAKQELAAGDLPQSSEKGWGATAQILKAVAEQRGWEHSRHRHHLVTVSRLRAETGDGDIRRLFNTASALHENFYENMMSAEDIAESLDDVQALLREARDAAETGVTTSRARVSLTEAVGTCCSDGLGFCESHPAVGSVQPQGNNPTQD